VDLTSTCDTEENEDAAPGPSSAGGPPLRLGSRQCRRRDAAEDRRRAAVMDAVMAAAARASAAKASSSASAGPPAVAASAAEAARSRAVWNGWSASPDASRVCERDMDVLRGGTRPPPPTLRLLCPDAADAAVAGGPGRGVARRRLYHVHARVGLEQREELQHGAHGEAEQELLEGQVPLLSHLGKLRRAAGGGALGPRRGGVRAGRGAHLKHLLDVRVC